ncbi:MAG TPA: pyridoxal kinase PdxY [Geminicoccaceae bacterium]|nr:pyridoxal kinase PdxY [Geminicoccaceae bacterium]
MSDGILSIQSAVAYGHVGNSAAVFPLQRLGFEVWPVSTVLFSNHTGYGAWRGRVVGLDWVEEIVEGIAERGAIPRTCAVLSGYLGDPSLGEAVLRAVARVREARPDMVYACDPVMGDEGRGFFVRPGIPEFFRDRAVPAADLITPNQFELAWLAGRTIAGVDDALAAAAKVRGTGPRIVVCTSLETGREGELGVLADSAEASWLCRTPKLPVDLNGTGDAFTALFLGGWLAPGRLDQTLERAVAAMYALVEATHRAGSRELELVAAQDQLVAPARHFAAQRLR